MKRKSAQLDSLSNSAEKVVDGPSSVRQTVGATPPRASSSANGSSSKTSLRGSLTRTLISEREALEMAELCHQVVKTLSLKGSPDSRKENGGASQELLDSDLILPSVLPFKRSQLSDRYPKGHSRGRHWKHLKQIIQAENYHLYPPGEPTYISIEAPPSMYPAKKYCDITGFEAPYTDPRTKLRYVNPEVFKRIRSLPDEYIQGFLALRNAAVVLK